MAQFKSEKEKKKWQQLQNQASTSLAKVIQGSASTSDVSIVSSVLGQLNKVAKNTFDMAVSSAEEAARLAKADQSKTIRDGLTEFEACVNKILTENNKVLLSQLEDIIDIEFELYSEELGKTIGNRFEEYLPRGRIATNDDLLASSELVIEQVNSDPLWERRTDDLLDRLFNMFRETLGNLKLPGSSNDEYTGGQRQMMNPYELAGAQKLTGAAEQGATELVEGETVPISTSGLGTQTAGDIPSVAVPKDPFQALNDRLDALIELQQRATEVSEDERMEDPGQKETRKADAWWKSFANWVSSSYKFGKKKVEDNSGWLSLLGKGLLSMILAPGLWKDIADTFDKYVTWDNIKNVAAKSWEWVSGLYEKYITWDNIKNVASSVWDWLKTKGTELWEWAKSAFDKYFPSVKKEAVKVEKKATDVVKRVWKEGVGWVERLLGVDQPQKSDASRMAAHQGVVTSAVTAPTTVSNKSFNASASGNVNLNLGGSRTSNLVKHQGSSQTTVINQQGIQVKDVPKTNSNLHSPAAVSGTVSKPTAVGTAPITMKTFGMTSATSDSLILMNTAFLY